MSRTTRTSLSSAASEHSGDQPQEINLSLVDRLSTGDGGIDFVGKSKTWYWATVVLLAISVLAVVIRGFTLSIDFEGGTKLNMPAENISVSAAAETFENALGINPEMTQIVGSGNTATLEIHSERLSEDQIAKARLALYEAFQPHNAAGEITPDAIGDSTVSESWGSTITNRMILSMLVFLVLAFIYIAVRLKREMAVAAMVALIVDAILIAGIYALFGFEVSPAAVIGLLTVLAFSIYDTVIVFDKVRENTEGILESRNQTYAEAANAAVNQTVMRSISTSVISALPIVALMVVAVWMLGVGALQDLALIQLIGVIEGVFSSIFLATPLLVTITQRKREYINHNQRVLAFRENREAEITAELADSTAKKATRTVAAPAAPVGPIATSHDPEAATTWRPGKA
ncbi:protein translocase subunit SecF [Corynebacterium caspium]|uniref:protein translocase subunit SecF n=1 Tax=Corynebacterium caspium TaxID=234828 RepID=UPI000378AA9E|nr:protein translocase subunit SecF [Corynebacterium caspium]WKD59179.1 preprotein translocase subunit SecF [Corynebacterium caspium DSM 44850]